MATLVSDIITSAFLNLGAIAPSETITSAEQTDAFNRLNQLLGNWSAEELSVYQRTKQTVPLTGAASYTLTGASRPVKIDAIDALTTTVQSLPLHLATPAEWGAYLDKSNTADFGDALFYADGYPTGTVFIAPKASGTMEIVSRKSIGASTLTVRETFALSGAASYTWGVGGTFSSERPLEILSADIAAASSISQPVQLLTDKMWASYMKKGAGGAFPAVAWYDGAFPTATLYVAPKAGAGTLEIYGFGALAAFAAVSDAVSLPQGYEQALVWNLTLMLFSQYNGNANIQTVLGMASNTKASLVNLNASIFGPEPGVLAAPPATALASGAPVATPTAAQ